MLRALTRLRSAGWGIALDDVGADLRSLALMSVLYPDVIKLDLRLLGERSPEDRARIVTAVGAEAERRRAAVLAEGIDSEEQLAGARAYGATLGQGYLLGAPRPLPAPLPEPGRGLKLPGGGGDPFGAAPWERVTNWRRPGKGSRRQAAEAARVIVDHAAELGPTAMVLASLADESHGPDSVARYGWLPKRSRSSACSTPAPRSTARACAAARSPPTTRCAGPARWSRSRPTSPPASSSARPARTSGRSRPPTTATR